MPSSTISVPTAFPLDARTLITTIAWLRACAALGQLLAVVATVAWLKVSLPLIPLAAGIALLALASPLTFWRLQQPWAFGEREACAHLAFDVLILGWALYFTGGASNPFITLLLVPVGLSAAALSLRSTAVVVLLAGTIYGVLIFRNVPLPDLTMNSANGFRLHLTGMAVNFLIAVLLLAVFIGRMRISLNSQREIIQRIRERTLRDEAVLAIATQAADAAHRLNTPLSTLRTLLPELEKGREQDVELRRDIQLMVGEVERCRKILHEMVEYGQHHLAGSVQTATLGEYVDASVDRFRLLRPEAEVVLDIVPSSRTQAIEAPPGLAHALLSLMQNALEASRQQDSQEVSLTVHINDGRAEFTIGDRGRGLPDERHNFMPAVSGKPNGLGIGLLLARSTIERLHGEIVMHTDATGTRVQVCVPLIQNRRT